MIALIVTPETFTSHSFRMPRDSVVSPHGRVSVDYCRYTLYQPRKVTTFDEIWQHVPHISVYQVFLCVISSFICMTTGFWLIYPVFGRTYSFEPSFTTIGPKIVQQGSGYSLSNLTVFL